jgi:hypothetical protein
MPPVLFVDAAAGTIPVGFNGLRFEIPIAKPRDTAIIAMVSEVGKDPDVDALEADGWTEVGTFLGNTRNLWIFRRELTTGEPAYLDVEFSIPFGVTPAFGVILVYRGLNNGAAVVGSGSTSFINVTDFIHPSLTLTTYSDLYIGFTVSETDAVTFTTADGTERIDHTAGGRSILAFDVLAEATGATGTKTSVASMLVNGFATSIALAADPVIGFGKSFTVEPLGAIGLPSRGV